jgi:hypothetical protein
MGNIKQWVTVALGCALTAVAIAKLPVPVLTEEQKAKAEEAKAKAAEAAKKAAEAEQRAQDRVAERYFREAKAAGKTVAPPSWVPPAAPAPATAASPVTPAKPAGAGNKTEGAKKS